MSGILILCSGLLLAAGAPVVSESNFSSAGRAYFAPISGGGLWRMRLPQGGIREFEPKPGMTNQLISVDGWTGELRGDWVRLKTPQKSRPVQEWCFHKGTLRVLSVDGEAFGIAYPEPVSYAGKTMPPLGPEDEVLAKDRAEFKSNWKDDGTRQQLWFTSPNRAGAFLVGVVLAALTLLTRGQGLWRVHGALIALSSAILLLRTGSRGAFLALAVGTVVVLACELRRRAASWRTWLTVVGCGLVALGLLGGILYGTIRTRQGNADSDGQHKMVFRNIPRMMCDAPGGWGSYRQVGIAYFSWYQGRADDKLRNNLIGDMETRLVGLGWVRGGLYLWLWVGGILCLLGLAWRGANPLPAVAWSALAITSSLNLILAESSVFVLPVLSLGLLIPFRPWRQKKFLACLAGVGLVLVGGGLLAIGELADRMPRSRPHVHRDGRRILVGGRKPVAWVVDDCKTLGGAFAPMEIRRHFEGNLRASAIGYVKSLDDLPELSGIRRLVLAGKRCEQFVERIAKGDASAGLPKSIVFISPSFPVSAVPESLLRRSNVELHLGEFAARYDQGVKAMPPWVKVVAGAEVYLPNWVSTVAGR